MSSEAAPGTRRGSTASVDDRVQDPAALAEIELYGDLVVAATGSDGPLEQAEIDRLLGLGPASDAARPGSVGQPNRPEM